jgi:C4-dicarboxylate-specific signal transduction histidine kinase
VAAVVTKTHKNPVFPTPLFFASIVISTWYGGGIPGLVAVVLAAFALDYYFIPPLGSLTLNKPEMPYLVEFAVPALTTCWFMKKRRITESTLRRARDELETKVRERQAELARVTRMMTVGELGVSVAHEVNQPLMAVVLNGDACLRWLGADPPNLKEAREAISRAVEQANRAGEIVSRIRALSKKTAPQRLPVNLNEAIEDSLALIERELAKNRISLKTELAHHLATVSGDRVQLQQVILNLLMNAIEAVGADGNSRRELTVRTESSGTGDVTVTVEDSGGGLPSGDLEQMFTAFFSTKPQGLGMGLAISRTIIETHGGRLWASDSGHGAVFSFRLPSG